MSKVIRRTMVLAALAVVAIAWGAWLPPPAQSLPAAGLAMPVRGVIHVHTRRSDGSGTVEQAAAAAARAGLAFLVFTDHGDARREPEPPVYRAGVLCIDAVEISTAGGHLVALNLPRAPYPLGGEPRDVVADVARLGGIAIAAHPDSAKPELRWRDWNVPIDGLEWLNADSEWRDEGGLDLARVLFSYPLRHAAALATLLNRPAAMLKQWDTLTRQRRVFAVAAADAHARIGLRSYGEPYDTAAALHLPSYESLFRTFSISLPQARLTGDARHDAAVVLGEIRSGHVVTSIDALAAPGILSFTATSGRQQASGGDMLTAAEPVMLTVKSNAPPGAVTTVFRDGVALVTGNAVALERTVPATRAVYRVEVQLPGAGANAMPWIVSNPIYVGHWDTAAAPPADAGFSRGFAAQYTDGPAVGWTVEKSAQASARLDVIRALPGTQILMRYALGGTASEGPYAAAAMPAGEALAHYDGVAFAAHADRPMRLSVQIRAANGDRWRRSVYLDDTPRDVSVRFADMTAVGQASSLPELAAIRSVLFVVDTVNARPGDAGQFWLDSVRYGR